jgi:hypothetical protein
VSDAEQAKSILLQIEGCALAGKAGGLRTAATTLRRWVERHGKMTTEDALALANALDGTAAEVDQQGQVMLERSGVSMSTN